MRGLLCVFFLVLARTGEGIDEDEYDTVGRLRNKPQPQDIFPLPYDEPVPFGHIARPGFGDPFSAVRQPFDDLELSMRSPKDKKEALELLKKTKGSKVFFIDPDIRQHFSKPNPKEEMLIERFVNTPTVNETKLKWYDLPTIQARNAMKTHGEQYIARKKLPAQRNIQPPSPPPVGEKSSYFSKDSFSLGLDAEGVSLNWTTCDQFAVGAVFAPKDVINVKWTPFYIWDTMGMHYSTEHTFEIPSNRLVNDYHLKFSRMINKTVDWTKAKLLMKGIVEALLIAADKRGLFHVIVKHQIPDSASWLDHKLPSLTLRLKIEDPYLVMMYCEQYFATVMAVSGNEPTEVKEMNIEAATIKFQGTGRPVWRNFDEEREKLKILKEAKRHEDDDKFIFVNDPLPPVGQWD